jgi:hypothetical protein
MEKQGSWAEIVATFANEELYSLCAPVIEQWIKDHRDPDYILTESCERDICVEVE